MANWFILIFILSVSNADIIKINILPDGKARELKIPTLSSSIQDTEWLLTTQSDSVIRLFCRMKTTDCLKASLTINNGKTESTYCGRRGAEVYQASKSNRMEVTLTTRGTDVQVKCLASAIKSFVSFDEPNIDSSEIGTVPGVKGTTCPCGYSNKNNGRIFGGTEAKINEYPFAAVIVRKDLKVAFCGGSIISHYHILTAAHCTYQLKKVALVAGIGEHNLSSATETTATKIIPVKETIEHKDFDPKAKWNDIAILVLEQKIEFNQLVGPICLPTNKFKFEGEFVKAMGWGRLFNHGPQSKVLMKANLKVIDFKQCADVYKNLKINDPHQFCTFGHDKDTCSGDSGGPVVWADPETNRYTQLGLVSYGKGCGEEGDTPGVNTDVTHYIDWIDEVILTTEPSETCTKI